MEQKTRDLPIEEFVKEQLFFGIHNHTEYSNLRLVDSNIVTEKIIDTAIELGHRGVTVSDHECISSHIRLIQHMKNLKELKEKYIKVVNEEEFKTKNETEQKQILKDTFGKKLALIEKMPQDFVLGLGNEIYLVDSLEEVRDNYQSGVTKFPHFVLQALDKEGHRQLRELSTQAWGNIFKNGAMERTSTTKTHLNQVAGTNKGHIIGSTACLGGELGLAVSKMIEGNRKLSIHKQTLELMKQNKENASKLNDEVEINKLRLYQNELKKCLVDVDKVQEDIKLAKRKVHIFITYCVNVFGKENFFIEIQPSNMQDQIDFNKMAINIAKSYGLKWIITTDTHYLTKAHQKLHKNFLNSKEGDREVDDFYSSTYMMDLAEMWSYFSHYVKEEDFKSAVLTTLEIKERVQEYDLYMAQQIPQRKLGDFEVKHIFKDYYKDNPYLEQCANSEYIQDRFFVHLVEEGFVDKKQIMNEVTVKRINDEIEQLIGISERMGQRMTSYYNLTELIIRILWSDKRGNSLVGVARGSVTGFYTCFLMGITQLNPIEWDLPYFRHISKTRPELPDIDIDTESLKRSRIFVKLKDFFGVDNVLNIATFKTEGSKSAVLTSARGLEINDDYAQGVADLIPFERGKHWTLSECLYGDEEKGRKPVKEFINAISEVDGWLETALDIESLVVGRGVHASGVYIFNNGYLEQNSRMRTPNGTDITCWSMNDSDYTGGVKLD